MKKIKLKRRSVLGDTSLSTQIAKTYDERKRLEETQALKLMSFWGRTFKQQPQLLYVVESCLIIKSFIFDIEKYGYTGHELHRVYVGLKVRENHIKSTKSLESQGIGEKCCAWSGKAREKF